MRRHAFTLIELLVTICVIVVLIGLLLTGLSIMRRMRARMASERLLSQLVYAMTTYLDANPSLDATAVADFNGPPSRVWPYLGRSADRLLELPLTQLGDDGGKPVSDPQDARTILDGFGEPGGFQIGHGPPLGR